MIDCSNCGHPIHNHTEAILGKALAKFYRLAGENPPPPKCFCRTQIWDDPEVYCDCKVEKFVLDVEKI